MDEIKTFDLGFKENEDINLSLSESEDFNLTMGDVLVRGGGGGGTNDFNKLINRPSYAGERMTGETDIPEVIQYKAGENIKIEGDTISAEIGGSNLATVAYTGDYNDLENEPRDFTDDEWGLLWSNYQP